MELRLTLHLQASEVRVQLHNPTKAAVRVWQLGNSWGGAAWSLRLTPPQGKGFTLRPSKQVYTRNVPRFLEIPANGQQEIRLSPSQPVWTAGEDLAPLREVPIQVQVVLEAPASPEAKAQGVATGRVESAPVVSQPPHAWLFGP